MLQIVITRVSGGSSCDDLIIGTLWEKKKFQLIVATDMKKKNVFMGGTCLKFAVGCSKLFETAVAKIQPVHLVYVQATILL